MRMTVIGLALCAWSSMASADFYRSTGTITSSTDGGPSFTDSFTRDSTEFNPSFGFVIGNPEVRGAGSYVMHPRPTLAFLGDIESASMGRVSANLNMQYTFDVQGAPNSNVPVVIVGFGQSVVSGAFPTGVANNFGWSLLVNQVIGPGSPQRYVRAFGGIGINGSVENTTLGVDFGDITQNPLPGFVQLTYGSGSIFDNRPPKEGPDYVRATLPTASQSSTLQGLLTVNTDASGRAIMLVDMFVSGSLACFSCHVTDLVDPYFFIEPSYLAAHPEAAVVFDPRFGNAAPVPEPASWLTLAGGIAVLATRRWMQRSA